VESDTGLDGFLTDNLAIESALLSANDAVFDLARQMNRECHSLIFNRVEVPGNDGQAILVVTLFLRALQHFQASILLLRKGLVAAGKVIIRAELEAIFALRAVASDEVNFRAFVSADMRERLNLIKKSRQYEYPILKMLREAISDDEISQLEAEVQQAGVAKKLTVRELSEQAKLHELYVSVYPILSRAAHSGVRELEAYLITDSDGEVSEIEYSPDLDDVVDLLLTACDFILLGADTICRQFEIENLANVSCDLSAAIASR
jgi:hypothetical protein